MRASSSSLRSGIAARTADYLRREILQGHFPIGQKLPAERDLAVQLDTNRNTLREALRVLESEGLVKANHGSGVVVLDFRRQGDLGLVARFLAEGPLEERMAMLVDLVRFRRLALIEMARQAAERADGEAIAALQARFEDLRRVWHDDERAREADVAFYRALAEATRSLLSRWTFNTYAETYLYLIRSMPGMWTRPLHHIEDLSAVVEAIAAHDPDKAERSLDLMLHRVSESLISAQPALP